MFPNTVLPGSRDFFRAVFTSWLMAYTRLPVWLPVSIWR